MPKQKYDWNKIKMEFLLSEYDELEGFFKDKYKTATNGTIRKYTMGRSKEKQAYKNKIYSDVLKKKGKETAKDIETKLERYEMLGDEILQRMEEQFNPVGEDGKPRKINSNDIMNIRKIKRTEMGLPTNISKTENTNKDERSELTDDEKEALNVILKKSSK